MIRAALFVIACLVFADIAWAQGGVKQVRGDWITLGDVTPVTGDAAGILIGPAPPPGQTLSLDPVFLVATAKSAGVILAIPLDQPVLVSRAGSAPMAPTANPARQATPARQIGGPQGAPGEVLVLIRDVSRGGIISADDLEWQTPKAAWGSRVALGYDAVVGMEARRALKAGVPLQSADVKAPAVIRKGDPVTLVYATQGVRLTVDGVAQADAARGDSLRVLNTYSKRTIDAVASGPGEARVN